MFFLGASEGIIDMGLVVSFVASCFAVSMTAIQIQFSGVVLFFMHVFLVAFIECQFTFPESTLLFQ